MSYLKPLSIPTKPLNVITLRQCKQQRKISMITCYDYPSAAIVEQTAIDCILIGDSVAMTIHGYPDTTHATTEMMTLHTAAVRRGTSKFIISDMPFMSYRKSTDSVLTTIERLVQAGANAVKLEGAEGNLELITHIVHSGVPVVGHIGLTPQHINTLGGFRVQGRSDSSKELLLKQAKQLQQAGCFMLVLECVPSNLAQLITEQLEIPTIGIGAGPATDGQVLVWHDILGIQPQTKLKFLKQYVNTYEQIHKAISCFDQDVKSCVFPTTEHCFE